MKEKITLAVALAMSAFVANSQTLNILTFGEGDGPGQGEPGMMGWGISPNGQYVCGPLEFAAGYFIGDLESNTFIFAPAVDDEGAYLGNVDNDGVAIGFNGPGVTFSIDGVETVLEVPSEEYKYIVGHDLSDDGSVMVGDLVGVGYTTTAAYSRDGGQWTALPFPDDIDLGQYNRKISTALCVSGDGKYILGTVGALGPAMLWVLNEQGEYEADPIFQDYAMTDKEDLDKPFISFKAENISSNGKHILLSVQEYDENVICKPMAAIYNPETRELDVYSDNQEIDEYGIGITPIAIADNGTFIGIIGAPAMNFGTFIMKSGSRQAETFAHAFPDYEKIWENLNIYGYHVPTGISADGSRILGNGWYSENPYDEITPAYFMTYVLDLSGSDGVEAIEPATSDDMLKDIYTIDGKRVQTPVKGLNIIRLNNGKVIKVMK